MPTAFGSAPRVFSRETGKQGPSVREDLPAGNQPPFPQLDGGDASANLGEVGALDLGNDGFCRTRYKAVGKIGARLRRERQGLSEKLFGCRWHRWQSKQSGGWQQAK